MCPGQMNLKFIILSEISQSQKVTYCVILLMWHSEKWKRDQWLPGLRGRGRIWLQREEQQKGIWGDVKSHLHLDCRCDYKTKYICQNSDLYAKRVSFIVHKVHFNKSDYWSFWIDEFFKPVHSILPATFLLLLIVITTNRTFYNLAVCLALWLILCFSECSSFHYLPSYSSHKSWSHSWLLSFLYLTSNSSANPLCLTYVYWIWSLLIISISITPFQTRIIFQPLSWPLYFSYSLNLSVYAILCYSYDFQIFKIYLHKG